MEGVGKPASAEAQLWHGIAARNGIVCPHGPRSRAEWNHCQPTSFRIVFAENPLRDTVTAGGPLDLESMFEAGNALIASIRSAADSLSRADPTPPRTLEAADQRVMREPGPDVRRKSKRIPRAAAARIIAKSVRLAKLPVRRAARGKAKIAAEATRSKSKIEIEVARRNPRNAVEAPGGKRSFSIETGRRTSALVK
jgi:hypothetical protein